MNQSNAVRTVLITGANRGIGLEIARQLAQRKFHVILAARDPQKGQQAAESIRQHGQVSWLQLDVSDSERIHAAASRLAEFTDHLDVLINNAAIYPDHGRSLISLTRTQLVETFQANTFGPLEVVQAFVPFLRRSVGARVINVSSGYGQLNGLSPYEPSYCLSKLALNGLTIMLADLFRADGIAVNSLCPGWVRTDMGGPTAPLSVAEGADTAVWLADEAPHQFTGKFFRDRQEISW